MTERDEIGQLLRLVGPREPVSEDRASRVRLAVYAAWESHRRAERQRRRAGAALVAATVVAGAIGWRASHRTAAVAEAAIVEVTSGPSALAVGARVREGELVATTSTRVALRLSSGAGVRIDRDSRVRLGTGPTLELLAGGVYIVSSRPGAALQVRTPLGMVGHHGTRFEVRLVDSAVRLRVREGQAHVSQAAVRHEAGAGEELMVVRGRAPMRSRVSIVDADWDWTTEVAPAFPTEGRRLAEFLDWFSAESGRRVTFRDPSLPEQAREIVLRGSVEGLTPEEAIDVIVPAAGLAHRRAGDDIVLDRERRP